jgi:hypothetical protein
MIYYAEPEDSGEYVCYDANREYQRFQVVVSRLSSSGGSRRPGIHRQGFIFLRKTTSSYSKDEQRYAIRVYLNSDPVQMGVSGSDSKKCTGMTNAENLEIEWYDNNNQVF